jgi:hypothetical protein
MHGAWDLSGDRPASGSSWSLSWCSLLPRPSSRSAPSQLGCLLLALNVDSLPCRNLSGVGGTPDSSRTPSKRRSWLRASGQVSGYTGHGRYRAHILRCAGCADRLQFTEFGREPCSILRTILFVSGETWPRPGDRRHGQKGVVVGANHLVRRARIRRR